MPTDTTKQPETGNLGTRWVPPGEGSTWQALAKAFGSYRVPDRSSGTLDYAKPWERTNLQLTGAPIQAYDRQRWESGEVK